MTNINTDITTHHVTLATTKFEVARGETQAKQDSLFTFKASMIPPYQRYYNLDSYYKRAIATISRSIRDMQQTTEIYFTCDQAVKVHRVTYPGFTLLVYRVLDRSDGELKVSCAARYEDQGALTVKAAETLVTYFKDDIVTIYRQYFNDIKQATIINYLQDLMKNIPDDWIYRKTKLTAELTEKTQKKDKLMVYTKQWLDQYRSSTSIKLEPCSYKDEPDVGEAPISNFF